MNEIKELAARWLESWPGLAGCGVLREYPARRELPLKGPALVVGLDGVDLSPAGLDGYLGTREGGPAGGPAHLYGNWAVLTLRLDLYLPGSDGGGCHRLYEEVCAALTARAAAFGLLRLWCDPLAWDSAAGASRLTARAALRAAFSGEERAESFAHYRVRSEIL